MKTRSRSLSDCVECLMCVVEFYLFLSVSMSFSLWLFISFPLLRSWSLSLAPLVSRCITALLELMTSALFVGMVPVFTTLFGGVVPDVASL